MPRRPRIQAVQTIYHLTTQSACGTPLYGDDDDRWIFLTIAHSVLDRFRWVCIAYCLMTTHYHLLIRTTDDARLAHAMKRLNWLYASTRNARYGAKGHVFGERYGSTLVESEAHLKDACRYVALNPVRAGLCLFAEEWRWSSHGEALGIRTPQPFFDPYDVLGLFDDRPDVARVAYKRYVDAPRPTPRAPYAAATAASGNTRRRNCPV
jgi:REP element-mobilizing transposase RayT